MVAILLEAWAFTTAAAIAGFVLMIIAGIALNTPVITASLTAAILSGFGGIAILILFGVPSPMVIERAQVVKAVEDSAYMLHLHPAVTEDMKVSDVCMDSLEYVELLIGVETGLDCGKEIPEDKKPSGETTIGALVDWVMGCVNA